MFIESKVEPIEQSMTKFWKEERCSTYIKINKNNFWPRPPTPLSLIFVTVSVGPLRQGVVGGVTTPQRQSLSANLHPHSANQGSSSKKELQLFNHVNIPIENLLS